MRRFNSVKRTVKRYATVVVATSVATAVAVVYYQKRNGPDWTGIVLDEDQQNLLAKNSSAVLAFVNKKILVLGRDWNPDEEE